jgi:esterase/lipase superfamily enzyme
MPNYWLITNRTIVSGGFGADRGDLSFWVADTGPLDQFSSWTSIAAADFKTQLISAADAFPQLAPAANEDQSHVTLFVHGYNTGWQDAARRYQTICDSLFSGADGLGLCVGFDWPSYGSPLDYLPDRAHAQQSAGDLAGLLSELYDWLLVKQRAASINPADACKAKVSVIAHSMGNYVLQKAMAAAWTRNNQPLLASLINQLVVVAADVDNDLFEPQSSDAADGGAIANLTYRVTSLYSGRDAVLGASAGLKHFGTRRLGRSGLAVDPPSTRDNIWDIDCSGFFPATVAGLDIHSAYFGDYETIPLIRGVLRGLDRTVLSTLGLTTGTQWP